MRGYGIMSGSTSVVMAAEMFVIGGCATQPNSLADRPSSVVTTAALSEQYASAGVVLPASDRVEALAVAPVTAGDVVAWTRRGWTDEQIIDRLDGNNAVFHLDTSDELRLRDAGVSDEVIRAMKASAWK